MTDVSEIEMELKELNGSMRMLNAIMQAILEKEVLYVITKEAK